MGMLLQEALEASWGADTAHMSEHFKWSADNPSCGQCCVTALVVQDYHGGVVLRMRVYPGGMTHYINRLPDGTRVDFAAAQFGDTGRLRMAEEKVVVRREILRYRPLRVRYELLARRVREALQDSPPAELA
jgi:hypothetical protein